LDAATAVRMIETSTRRLGDAADELSGLDAVAGDGDHGVNIAAAFAHADGQVAAVRPQSAAEVFRLVGRSFSERSGGAAGALFGAFFATLGDRLRGPDAPGVVDLVDGLDLASHRVAAIGRTAPGGKTMVDALQPAAYGARAALEAGGQLSSVLVAAAAAAARGAAATADMRATAGRARYAPDGAVGTRDPGAVTIAVMFAAWADAVAAGDSRAVRLDRLATGGGQFAILALDHVRSFATTLRPDDPDSLTADETLDTKERLIAGLAGDASAVLIDPGLAVSRLEAGASPLAAGLIVGIEDGDYEAAVAAPRLLPGWTVERAARLGADAVKISVAFDADGDTTVAERFVRETVRECELVDLPLFCEPLAPDRDGADRGRQVLEGIRRFGSLGADVLKIQFPCDTGEHDSRDRWAEACAAADELSVAPWALLSEGRAFEEFRELLTIACQAGASGFLAGRAIWGGAAEAGDGIAASAARLGELRAIAIAEGRSWRRHGLGPGTPNPGMDA
jgi:tagatose 1,6-diphosphate aldolase